MQKITFLFILFTVTLHAQVTGSLDINFATNGVSELFFDDGNNVTGTHHNDIVRLADGSLFVVGNRHGGCSGNSSSEGTIFKYTENGILDTSFHGTGFISLSGSYNFYKIISIDTNNFLLTSPRGVIKVNAMGIFDSNYGINGFAGTKGGQALLDDTSGDLYYSTVTSLNKPVIYKFDANGVKDTSFGSNGALLLDTNNSHSFSFSSLKFDVNNDIVIVGRDYHSVTDSDFVVIKFTTSGTLVNSFGNNGVFIHNWNNNFYAKKLFIDNNNDITCYGSKFADGMVLFKVLENGTLDTSFGNNGISRIHINSDSTPNTLHVLYNGNFFVTGTGYNNMFVAKIDSNGSLVSSFGNNGFFLTPSIPSSYNTSSIIINDKILLVGNTQFADCWQTKYKGLLTQYYLGETLSTRDFYNNISVYPNPIKDVFNIKGIENIESIKIFDFLGKEILSKVAINATSINVNLKNMNDGMYLIKINTNKFTFYKRIIKTSK